MDKYLCLKNDGKAFYPGKINRWVIDMFKEGNIIYIKNITQNKYLYKANKHNELVWFAVRIKKVSSEWIKDTIFKVLDYAKWDKKNLEFSFHKEPITKEEFDYRLKWSTAQCIKSQT